MKRAAILAVCAALSLGPVMGGCAQLSALVHNPAVAQVSIDVAKAQIAARALQDVANKAVINAHAAGALTGALFNKAKADLATANADLDKADAYIAKGQQALASPLTSAALSLLANYAGAAK